MPTSPRRVALRVLCRRPAYAAAAVLVTAALAAAWMPARRAATLDPMAALRHD